ncbi:MAG: ribonuclease H-like domain-containing protein [Clostridium sp.]|nr:ribonuclease H-like domain-containing protein [Acetatifactor muris]MCM1528321.1 ribonuclease H-like domain-containing protein [Bacteroides sp.]MCM1562525.1 ribonuclease H-like domain-containing protein [Clostridium sp.]
MRIYRETLDHFKIAYPLEKQAPPESTLFLDIETTGFAVRSSCLYMIGCAYYRDGRWHTIQWLAENYEQEGDILQAFLEFAAMYRYLVHFNGNNFDLPFLMQKCEQLEIPHCLDAFEGIDLYRRISPCKALLKLPNCKQKTLEQFLGIDREDVFSGGELIGIYHDYVKSPNEFAEKSLLLHNSDDLKGMLDILPMLAYSDLFGSMEPIRARKVQANSYRDLQGNSRRELLITVTLPTPLPRAVSAAAEGCYFRGEGKEAVIKVPIFDGELKYFYANYKDYYYLPSEDIALHKSVAGFVDKEHRIQASAANCYTRKISGYLPQWDGTFEPYFKQDYRSSALFFELTDEIKRDRETFNSYANQVFQMIAASC